ncbi:ribosome maturation factor RimP [Wukongibacter baidiensis]|uniref:ribosome maturation factor RimP n=1 Tax=Wukongibacter baidiensis TaxID=1723361 RepID=UPI003D7F8A6B
MKKKRVVDIVEEIVLPFLEEKKLDLVEIEFVKEGQHRYLRVYLDKDDGLSLDDCQSVSEYLSERLDTLDPIKENYFLEVSSPGIERPLKKDTDFEKYSGKLVEARLYHPLNGEKIIKGNLLGLKDNMILIDREAKGTIEIARDKVSLVKLLINFD